MPGHPPVGGEKAAVHVGGEQPHRPGQIAEHGDGQVGVLGEYLGELLLIHRHHLAGGHRDGGGHPGLPVEEGGLPDEIPRTVEGEGALLPLLRGHEAAGGPLADVVKLVGPGALEIDNLAGREGGGGPALGQGSPHVSWEAHGG